MGIKNWLTKFISPHNYTASTNDYFNIAKELFEDPNEVQFVHTLLVKYICENGFEVNPSELISLFKEYDYTMDQFFVVLFKLGTLAQLFVDKPDLMLKYALNDISEDQFSEKTLNLIQGNLKGYRVFHEDSIKAEYEEIIAKEQKIAKDKVTLSEDEQANNLIEEWIMKFKGNKNVDSRS